MLYKLTFFSLALLFTSLGYGQRIYDITRYGAVADNASLSTKAIQKAIDLCSANGGGIVLLPKSTDGKTEYLTGTIILKNNVELRIDSGVVLLGSINYSDYQAIEPFVDGVGQNRGACLIGAASAINIAITGKGTINGQGDLWKNDNNRDYARRPFLLRIVKSDGCKLRDLHLTKSAAWMCNFDMSKNILIDHVDINNRVNTNNDGIDIDACEIVSIKNCKISSSDDAICFKSTRGIVPCQNIQVFANDISSSCGGIKWGTESVGDFNNFTISNNYIHDTNLGGIKILTADGANVSNIKITDTKMKNVNIPVFICIKNRLKTYHDLPGRTVGSIKDVNIDGISAIDCRTAGILITGIPGRYIGGNIRLSNITLSGLGSDSTIKDGGIIPPENESAYPEVNRFGVLPAYGAFIRHTKGIVLTNINISKKQPDQRYAIVFDDTEYTLSNFIAQKDNGGLPLVNMIGIISK
jgi:polygalacturonase